MTLFDGFLNSSHSDCGKNGPETNEEMRKDAISLLAEELSLQKDVADDNLQRTKALITATKKTSSHYQKEAEKCNAGMETCEEAREKAEAGLIEELLEAELTIKEGQGIGTSCRLFPWILLLYKDVNLNDTDITNACKTKNLNFHN
ncbi:hypothetical protein RHGRI_014592 [Rhododendron griersonianum]|uniref:Uncharacterized protein n=1 Tax=Rhododendron griersonianum TaxID=479676 RepID=A0AAV6K9W9_9ERIC|nr:hypothetical protein RHGRI_014592 [Rhododendron griersonianum]